MNPEEWETFCGTLCMAAKRLQIGIAKYHHGNVFQFGFIDPIGGGKPTMGEEKPTEKEALFSACQALQNSLSAKSQPSAA